MESVKQETEETSTQLMELVQMAIITYIVMFMYQSIYLVTTDDGKPTMKGSGKGVNL